MRAVRHALLTDLIREVHQASRGTYGYRRVHAELTRGRGLVIAHGTVELLMARVGLAGVTGRPRWKGTRPDLIAKDLVDRGTGDQRTRHGHRLPPATGRDDHPLRTRDRSSGPGPSPTGPRTPGWCPRWAASGTASTTPGSRRSGRMQVELLDRQRWRTRIELANTIFEHLEIRHNRRRRHSALGWVSPMEFESNSKIVVAQFSGTQLHGTRGTPQCPADGSHFSLETRYQPASPGISPGRPAE